MAKFPEVSSVPYAIPLKIEIEHKTLITNFDDLGAETRKQKWLYPKRNVYLGFNHVSKSEIETLWQFYIARKGATQAFAFFIPTLDSNPYGYVDEYVGTGDGSTVIFNLPCRTSASRTLYVDSVSQDPDSSPPDYTFSALGGTDGEDKVTFTVAPTAGQRITLDFTGYLKIRCRFADDNLSWEEFYDRLVKSELKLKGLLNA